MNQAGMKKAIKVATEEFASVLFSIFSQADLGSLAKSAGGAKKPGRPAKAKAATKPAKKEAAEPKVKRRANLERSAEAMNDLVAKVVKAVDAAGDGLAISEIAKQLRLDVSDLSKPIGIALKDEKIVRKGERRGAKYFPK